jgi:choline monooxygenase
MPSFDPTSIITAEVLAQLRRDTGEARGLPGLAYGPDAYALEQRVLFPRLWCAVGFSSDVPEPGDVVPAELAGWPLILLRDREGEVRAFHNICRHRGMRLVTEPAHRRDGIVCPWHAWRYQLDGALRHTPRVGGDGAHRQAGLVPGELGLVPVRLALWHDFIFVNLDGKAPPFAEHIAPLDRLLAPYELGALRRADRWSLVYPGNWKVAIEGAIEDYHLPSVHPQLVQAAGRYHPKLDYADRCFYSNSLAREFADPSEGNIAITLQSGLPSIPWNGEGDRRRTFFMNVFPTGMFQMHGDNAVQGLFAPEGPDRTRLVFNHYYVGAAAASEDFAAPRAAALREWRLVFEQDIPLVRYVQENYQVRDAAGIDARFSTCWEANIHRFQRAVAEVLAEGAGAEQR